MPKMICQVEGMSHDGRFLEIGEEFSISCDLSAKRLADRGKARFVERKPVDPPQTGNAETKPAGDPPIPNQEFDIESIQGLLALPRHPKISEKMVAEAAETLVKAGIEPTPGVLAPLLIVDSKAKLFGEIDSLIALRQTPPAGPETV